MAIVFNNLNFAAGEEVIITGTVDDTTVTTIQYGGTNYPLADSTFSFNLGVIEPSSYEFVITLVDGLTPGEVITETIIVDAPIAPTLPELTEEELIDMAKTNDPTPDFVADYVPYVETNTAEVLVTPGSVTGFWPIETTEQKFPVRRNIDITHPNPTINGSDGLFNDLGRKADLLDEDSGSNRLTTRSASGSAIFTTGFTL